MIAAEKDNRKIAVKIKSFVSKSEVDDLENALGQFVLYYELLAEDDSERKLFLAVRQTIFEGIFSHRIGQILLQKKRLSLVVFNEKSEEILQWTS